MLAAGADFTNKTTTKHERFLFYLWVGKNKFEKFKNRNNMNVLSLFDGMSCGQIALERAGIKVDNYFASEIETPAIEVTMKNYQIQNRLEM